MKRLLMILAAMVSLAVRGQDTIVLQSVEISASPIRNRIEVATLERKMDTSVIRRLNTVTMSQLLIQHSPVFIKTYGPGGLATASFRGTTASHTLVQWNGMQINAPSLGQVDFSTIPVFMTDNVALRWGSGTSENSGGIGGVVDIENEDIFKEGLILDLKQNYGSFNTIGSFATVGYSGENNFFRIKAYRSSSDNDFVYNNVGVIPHQTMRQKNGEFVDYGLMPEYHLRYKNSQFSVSSWNQWSDRNCPQIMPNVNNSNTKEFTVYNYSRNYISYKNYWNSGELEAKAAYFFEQQNYFLNSFTDNGNLVTSIDSKNRADIFHYIINVRQTLYKTWSLKAKIQFDNERVGSNNYVGTKEREVLSLYTALSGDVTRYISLRLTLRNDVVDWKSAGIFPTATAVYKSRFVDGLKLTLGYSHNYRSPSMNDLYWNPGGNPDLRPEKGKTFDGNISFAKTSGCFDFDCSVGAYYSEVDDWIQWKPTVYRFWVPENVAEVVAYGSEIHFKAGCNINDWTVSLSGNYVYSHTTDESGLQLIYIPLHHANLFAELRWRTWSAAYTLEFTGERKTSMNADEFYGFKLYPYTLHHLSLGKRLGKFTLELIIRNITDVDYQAVLWRAMPGRSFELSAGFKL
ncbi:MAG: TonB-dependent receptor plug domain-containing protein [Candidatus Limimorpha sp.]